MKPVSDEPVRAAMPKAEAAISHESPTSESMEAGASPLDPPAPNSVVWSEPTPTRRSNLALSAEQREQLLQRLAMGAKNAELAHEFRLTMQQVQGVRMGSGREIAARRERLSHPKQLSEAPKHVSEQTPNTSICTADDVIRYLRQQDDVVVPQGNGEFVINGRFRLPFSEVITRANKMRRRQGKPDFDVAGSPLAPAPLRAANGHPVFWAERKAAANGANLPES